MRLVALPCLVCVYGEAIASYVRSRCFLAPSPPKKQRFPPSQDQSQGSSGSPFKHPSKEPSLAYELTGSIKSAGLHLRWDTKKRVCHSQASKSV